MIQLVANTNLSPPPPNALIPEQSKRSEFDFFGYRAVIT